MIKSQKWNFKKREYDPYALPEGASCYEDEMDTVIACAQCGKKMTFGDGYTSRQIHTDMGFGFAVCEKCYEKEWKEERLE
jgi:hypothetical protein